MIDIIMRLLTVIVLIIGTLSLGIAQDSTLLKKVGLMEKEILVLKDSLNAYSKVVKKYEGLNNDITSIKSFTGNPVTKFLLKWGIWILGAFVILILLLIALFIWLLNKIYPKWFVPIIQKWVDRQEGVNLLKENKNILVISKVEHPQNEVFLDRLLSKKEFKGIVYKTIDQAEDYIKQSRNDKEVDIIFANNESKNLSQDILENLIKNKRKIALFYFGKPGSWNFRKYGENEPEFLKRINFANSRSQIYGNLISSLKFQDTLMGIQ